MSKFKEILLKQSVLPINYEAQKWLNWFGSDCQTLQNLCSQIFRGSQLKEDVSFQELLSASSSSIDEVLEDITKLKEFLDTYKEILNNYNIDLK